MESIIPVLMCGGSGTRLWPVSRSSEPKQFHPLVGGESLFQQTLQRFCAEHYAQPLIVVHRDHSDLVLREIERVNTKAPRLLIEPCMRGTGPAIAAAAALVAEEGPDRLMLVVPSDHVIGQIDVFSQAVSQAVTAARQERIVLFGIRPTYPETGFGYIETGDAFDGSSSNVVSFVEKPARDVAETFVARADRLWNSGIFMFTARTIIEEFERYAPDVMTSARRALSISRRSGDTIRLGDDFCAAPATSIDYAVMERSNRLVCVPAAPEWSDLGSWSALWGLGAKDENGNVSCGDILLRDVRNSYVHGGSRLVAVMGVEGIAVIDTADAVLVSSLDQSQNVGKLAAELAAANRPEAKLHKKVCYPWGSCEVLRAAETFQVKHIIVNAGACLSLQYHHYQSGQWTVVSGTAQVTADGRVLAMKDSESIFIPEGRVHSLKNIGPDELHLIEVQCRTSLGKDDTMPLEDRQDYILSF